MLSMPTTSSGCATLPTMHRDEARGLVFVHGGIDPKTFPNESDEIRMWTRSEKFFQIARWPDRDELKQILVVHGHTPTRRLRAGRAAASHQCRYRRLFRRPAYVCGAGAGRAASLLAREIAAISTNQAENGQSGSGMA